jgi:hypothetical protein
MVKERPQAVPQLNNIVLSQQQDSNETIPLMEPSASSDYIDS